MNNLDSTLDKLHRDAAEYLNAGQKQEAREVLRAALKLDRNNLATWEFLWRAAYNLEEEEYSLNRILRIDPKHAAAKKRLAEIQSAGEIKSGNQPPSQAAKRPVTRRKKQQTSIILLLVLWGLVFVLCLCITGFTLLRGGYIPLGLSSNMTSTAVADKNASCQVLIDRAIQASGSSCDSTASNTACYGNNTLKAVLAPAAAQQFSERGDIIAVKELRRLAASPLNIDQNEWGIAVFKLVANLPRSLPGETVTMVVFGNATLDNQSGTSDSLESFYFSSEFGQIVCEKIPFDGLVLTSPDGSGIRFFINGAELTLMGNAGIKAVRNEEMEVSVYKGSARIVSEGQEQYVGAGQKSSVQLGGENGTQSVSPPSLPEPLTGNELTVACTMTGQYCSPAEIVPVSVEQAQSEIQSAITSTPTITRTPSSTVPPTYTLVVLPSITPSSMPTRTATATKPSPTKTPGPTRTMTRTPTRTNTPTRTSTPTRTHTPTRTNTPTSTATSTPSFTPTYTPTTASITATPVSPSEPPCGPTVSLSALTNPNANELGMDITNNSGSIITINRFFAYWVKSSTSQKVDKLFLNGNEIWNKSDPDSPSDIPTEGNWLGGADLTIPDGTVGSFVVEFSNNLLPTGYEVHIVFDSGCQVIGTK